MEYNQEKVDELTLALLWLVSYRDQYGPRAWKGFDWDTMNRLHEKGFIADPKSKAKSVSLSEDGIIASEKMFAKHFGKDADHQSKSV